MQRLNQKAQKLNIYTGVGKVRNPGEAGCQTCLDEAAIPGVSGGLG